MNRYGTMTAPLAFCYGSLSNVVQTEIETLLTKAIENSEITKKKIYKFHNYEAKDYHDHSFEITLYPNGSCKVEDQFKYMDTYDCYESFGIYTLLDTTLEMDLIYYLFGTETLNKYYEEVETVHYSFERNLQKDEFISNTLFKLGNANRFLPTIISFNKNDD